MLNKFGFADSITNNAKDMINAITNTQSVPSMSVNVNSKWYKGTIKVLDLSWYAPYKDYGDNIICIFCYCSFLWNIFLRLPDIISGAGASSYVVQDISDISYYKKHGFGRVTSNRTNTAYKRRNGVR